MRWAGRQIPFSEYLLHLQSLLFLFFFVWLESGPQLSWRNLSPLNEFSANIFILSRNLKQTEKDLKKKTKINWKNEKKPAATLIPSKTRLTSRNVLSIRLHMCFFVLIKVLVSEKCRWRPTGEIQRHMFQREKVIDNTSSVTGGRVG